MKHHETKSQLMLSGGVDTHTSQQPGASQKALRTTVSHATQSRPDLPLVALLLARLAVRRYLAKKETTND